MCENLAKNEFGWKLPSSTKQSCPTAIDISYAFGKNALSVEDIAKKRMGKEVVAKVVSPTGKRSPRAKTPNKKYV